jgi:uncharacterized membrane protein
MTLVTALGCGLVAGVFFAFSSFVMPALSALPPAQGLAAMQSINVKAVTPVFMIALFGTALGCLAAAAIERDAYTVAGAALYLVGTIGVTIAYHVPRNDALAAVEPGNHEAWARYLREWTAGNHVRAAAALAAAALFTASLQA